MRAAVLSLLLAAPAAAAFSPSPYLDFNRGGPEIADHCAKAKSRAEMKLRELASLSHGSRTFANTPAALENALSTLWEETASDQFAKYVSVSSAARDAANDCETIVKQLYSDVYAREGLYAAVSQYAASKPALAGEDARLLEKELMLFKRGGMALPAERREMLRGLRRKLAQLEADFGRNVNEAKGSLSLTRAELAGLPDDYVSRLPRDGELYRVSLDYPDYFPFMKNARDPGARRRLDTLFGNRAAGTNVAMLREVLALRREAAQLLGYRDHADYMLELRMAKDAKTVRRFIDRLVERLQPPGKRELAALVAMKDKEEGPRSDHVLRDWDWPYYDNQRLKARAVDLEKIKEYFPLETVLAGLFDVYQKLLGVKFRRVDDPAPGVLWHPDAPLYEVSDASSGEVQGYFYMDLFPRDGKYKHAMSQDLVDGRRLSDGTFQKPVAAIVANFPKPAPGRPSLLRHGVMEDVETLFHEFGHVMHQTLTKARYGLFAGAGTMSQAATDFVEAPSQMLENWVWEPSVIERISGRYDDPRQKLPREMLDALLAAKKNDIALTNLRQLHLANVDLDYHTRSRVDDPTAVWSDSQLRIMMVPMPPGTAREASFDHIVGGGYDVGYYGYLWSLVYAQDMFSSFERRGLLDPVLGRRYREEILEPGASRDEAVSLRRFLGREPDDAAFLRHIGLAQ